jgi:hypothetical protein
LHEDYANDAEVQTTGYLYQDYLSHSLKLRRQALFGQMPYEKLTMPKPPELSNLLQEQHLEDDRAAKIRKHSSSAETAEMNLYESESKIQEADATGDHRPPIGQPPFPMQPVSNLSINDLIRQLHELAQRTDQEILGNDSDSDEGETAKRLITVSEAEALLCTEEANRLSVILEKQNKWLSLLLRECEQFNRVWNKRVLFYKYLQRLSDDVRIPQDVLDPEVERERLTVADGTLRLRLETENGRLRYLKNLLEQMNSGVDANGAVDELTSERFLCQICRGDYREADETIVTICGVS